MVATYSNSGTSYRAIQLPFSINSLGSVASSTDPSKVWADRVLSVVGTQLGERAMQSNYGTNIGQLFFDTIGDVEKVFTAQISAAFDTYLRDLTLDSITFEEHLNEGNVTVNVHYFLPNKEEQTTSMGIAKISGNKPIISQE
jgi:phage baseplate assembly protein W